MKYLLIGALAVAIAIFAVLSLSRAKVPSNRISQSGSELSNPPSQVQTPDHSTPIPSKDIKPMETTVRGASAAPATPVSALASSFPVSSTKTSPVAHAGGSATTSTPVPPTSNPSKTSSVPVSGGSSAVSSGIGQSLAPQVSSSRVSSAMPQISLSLGAVQSSPLQSSGAPSSSSITASPEEVIEVPPSANVPAALAPQGPSSTLEPASQSEVTKLADDFLNSVDQQTKAGVPRSQAWDEQQRLADDVFRAQYGWDAYVAENARANSPQQ